MKGDEFMFKKIIQTNWFVIKLPFKISKYNYIFYWIIKLFLSLLPVFNVYIFKLIIDELNLIYTSSIMNEYIWVLLTIYLVNIVIISILENISTYLKSILNDKTKLYIDNLVMEHMAKIDIETFDNPENANKIDVALNSTWSIANRAYWPVDAISYLISFLSACIVFLAYNYILGVIFLVTYIPGAIISFINSKKMDKFSLESVTENREKEYYKSLLIEKEYAKDIRIYNLKEYFFNKYKNTWKTIRFKRNKIFNKGFVLSFLSLLLSYSGLIFIIAYGVSSVIQKKMGIGDLSLYIGMGTQAAVILEYILYDFSSHFKIITPRICLFIEFLKWNPRIYENNGTKINEFESLTFKNVSFKYPNSREFILKDINFTINKGDNVAIVGINGAGKTTIIKLILRLYDVCEGEILVNNVNIKEISLKSLHSLFGVYFQDLTKYSLTLKESVALSEIKNVGQEGKINSALEQGDCINFINELGINLDSELTKVFDNDGVELSGGQWQKLAISRAFFKESQFIILDEPSSALDPIAEDKLFDSIIKLSKGKTSVIVSHRLSNIILSNKIIVLESGKVVEKGTHHELMELNGKYAYLYRLQSSKYVIKGEDNV